MDTTGQQSTPCRKLWIIFLAVMIGACGFSGEKKPWGDATPIPEGHSPLDVIRTIQNEFIQLKKPILKKFKYHKQWKKRRFADSTYTYGPFWEVVLTAETYDFFKKHTPREIFAALTPLLFDPQMGGEAAVLLSGIPAKDLETASTLHLGRLLMEIGYESPEDKGIWDIRSARCNSYIGYPGINFDAYETPIDGTLDQAIYTVLKEEYNVRNHPKRDYFEPLSAQLEGKTFKTLDEFAATHLKPKPSEKFDQFLASHKDLFSSTVLLASSRNNMIALMWSLDLESEYWPLSVSLAVFDHTPFRMARFKNQMSEMQDAYIYAAGMKIYNAYKSK